MRCLRNCPSEPSTSSIRPPNPLTLRSRVARFLALATTGAWVLGATPLLHAAPQGGCTTDEVILNTGYDHFALGVLPIGGTDPRWTVVSDPFASTTEPRPAAIIQKHFAWKAAEPFSQWISGYPTSVQPQNGAYEFETVFCLAPGINLADPNARIEIGMRADDACTAFLNGTQLHVGQAFNAATMVTTSYPLGSSGAVVGPNVLRIRVDNTGNVAMGLDLVAKVVAAPGNTAEKPECCNATSSIQGLKYHDLDLDGVRDAGEPGLSGWQIRLDGPGGPFFATTDSEGYYSFLGLLPGSVYTVTETNQLGWAQINPPNGTHTLTLPANFVSISGVDFGNYDLGPCATDHVVLNTGYDHAGGGVLAIGDVDPRWIVVDDPFASTTEPRPATAISKHPAWQDPEPDSQWISGYPSAVQTHNGAYIFETVFCLAPGFDDPLNDAQLVIGMRADDACSAFLNGSTTAFHVGQAFNAATMTMTSYPLGGLGGIGGVVGQNTLRIRVDNISNVAMGLDVVASVSAPSSTSLRPECCSNVGVLQGFKFHDFNGDGVRNLGEPTLAGWEINLVGSNGTVQSTVTDSEGYYSFVDLSPATYTLTETMQLGWTQTAPNSGSHVVTLTGIQGVSSLDFGNLLDPALPYCTSGTSTNGCVGTISWSGLPSVSQASGFAIHASNIEGQKLGLLFYGVNGSTAATWNGTSFLCVKAPTQRLTAQSSGGTAGSCDGSISVDWLAFVATHPFALGSPFSSGDVVNFQVWYRDPPALKTTNLTDALEVTLLP